MRNIAHIIHNDKFTIDYVTFFQKYYSDYNHTFITVRGKYNFEQYKNSIIEMNTYKELFSKRIKKILQDSDKIIVSGLFDVNKYLFFLPNRILKKAYLHFWGGDFYIFRDTKFFTKKRVHKFIEQSLIKRCNGIINLIDSDYQELSKIFPNTKKHFVGPFLSGKKDFEGRNKYFR